MIKINEIASWYFPIDILYTIFFYQRESSIYFMISNSLQLKIFNIENY